MLNSQSGRINAMKQNIKLVNENAKPVRSSYHRAERKTREVKKGENWKKVLPQSNCSDQTGMTRSDSFWAKEWDTVSVIVSYKRLNALTEWKLYPTSCVNDCNDALCKAAVFSTLDTNCSDWRVEMDKRDGRKVTVSSHYRLYRFIQVGLKETSETPQFTVNVMIAVVEFKSCFFVFVRNHDLFQVTERTHGPSPRCPSTRKHCRRILVLRKRIFFTDMIDYLCYVARTRCHQIESKYRMLSGDFNHRQTWPNYYRC